MTDRPLGIADLLDRRVESWTKYTTLRDAWFWCRQHEQAHKVGEKCRPELAGVFISDCIDIGPFMSEREANRLAGVSGNDEDIHENPLSMVIET